MSAEPPRMSTHATLAERGRCVRCEGPLEAEPAGLFAMPWQRVLFCTRCDFRQPSPAAVMPSQHRIEPEPVDETLAEALAKLRADHDALRAAFDRFVEAALDADLRFAIVDGDVKPAYY